MSTVIDPNSPERAFEQAARILRGRIDDGTYTGRIPSEASLASEFGINRLTLRRAIRLLVDEGLVVVVPGRGTFVKPA